MAQSEHRLSVIEDDLRETARIQRRNEAFLESFSREMRNFKDDTEAFKQEMRAFKDEMREFKDEMRVFKDEMQETRRESKREMNRRWGELANKMGTIVEDIILPGFPGVLRRYFDTEADIIMPRVRRRHPRDRSRKREFDIIAVDSCQLYLNETKSTPRMLYVREFVESYHEVFEYFPEYAGKTLVPIFSLLYLDEEAVAYLTGNGCYAMTMGEDHLDIVNFEAVSSSGGGAQ